MRPDFSIFKNYPTPPSELTERIFQGEASLYIARNDRNVSSHLMQSEMIIYGLVRKCVKLSSFW